MIRVRLALFLCAFSFCFSLSLLRGLAAVAQTNPAPHGSLPVLAYLKSISGKSTVAGIHNREPNRQPTRQTDRMLQVTGRYPGLWSGDFLFSADDVTDRWTMIRECRRQWDRGAIVQLLLHVAPPNQPEVCRTIKVGTITSCPSWAPSPWRSASAKSCRPPPCWRPSHAGAFS